MSAEHQVIDLPPLRAHGATVAEIEASYDESVKVQLLALHAELIEADIPPAAAAGAVARVAQTMRSRRDRDLAELARQAGLLN